MTLRSGIHRPCTFVTKTGDSLYRVNMQGVENNLINVGLFFLRLSDDEIAEADPVTKQYSFLTAASGESGDLSTTFFLLSKIPSLQS